MAELSDRLKEKLGVKDEPSAPSEAQQRVGQAELADETAPFGMEIGPFTGGTAAPAPSSSNLSPQLQSKLGKLGGGQEARLARGKGFTYVTTPPIDERQVARAAHAAIVYGLERNPYATNALVNDLDMLAGASEMAYLMNGNYDLASITDPETNPLAMPADLFQTGLETLQSQPELLEEFADYYWTDMMAALTATYGQNSYSDNGLENRKSNETVMRFLTVFRNEFSPEERNLILSIAAAVPTSDELLEAKGIDTDPSNPFATIVRNVKMAVQAPEAIRPYVNEPIDQLFNLAEDYWRNVDQPDDPATRVEFFNFMMSQANASIADVERIQGSGFAALAAGTVDIIPTVALDAANDAALGIRSTLPWSVGPNEYGARQGMSLGQNAAIGQGFHANDPMFRDVSGINDSLAQIFGDPQNLIFAAASAKKAANTFPRIASKQETLKAALNPFSKANSGKLPLHAMDTSNSARLFYAAFSKTADELLQAPKATKQFEWIARTAEASVISRRFPDLTENVVQFLAESKTTDEAREVWRYFMHGDEALAEMPEQVVQRLRATAHTAETDYVTALRNIAEAEGDEFNLSRLGFADGIDPEDIYVEVTPVRNTPLGPDDFDEGVTDSVLRSERRFTSGDQIDSFDVAGTPARIVRSGSNLGVYVGDEFVGAARNLDGKAPDIALHPDYRGKGIGRRLTDNMTPEQVENLRNATAKSGSAEALVPTRVLRRTKLAGDNSTKVAVTTLGNRGRKLTISDDAGFYRMQQWFDNNGHEELSAVIAAGGRLDQLTPDEFRAVDAYMNARGVDMISWGDEAYMKPGANIDTFRGVDGKFDPNMSINRTIPDEYYNWRSSQINESFAKKDLNGEKWIIHDLPSRKFSANIYEFGAWSNAKLPKRWAQKMRSRGFVMKHKYPENIDMANGINGRKQLRDWSKLLGMSDQWTDEWVARFDAANPITRKQVLDDWMIAVGTERNLPWLKFNLTSRVKKGGVSTFESGVDGKEIGLAADGSVTPMTLSHAASFYMMPDAGELMQSLKRWEQKSPVRVHRGIKASTKSRRAKILDNLQARMRREGYDTSQLSKADWARLAYSDAFRSEIADYRGYGAGVVNKVATAPIKLAKGFGSFFSIAQLAGRPIAWNSRVLIEESIRDLLMGHTAMLRNPVAYFNNVWDAASINRLKYLEATAASETTTWVNRLWNPGKGVDLDQFHKMFPDIPLDEVSQWTRGDLLSLVSREFRGGRDFRPRGPYPSRMSPYRKAYKNNRRIKAAKARIAEYNSIDETFDFGVDGKEIANRSYASQFAEEVGASSLPLEWRPKQMTPHQIDAAGHGYGRQTKQMLEDPIVGSYGVSRMRARLLGQDPDAKYNADKLAGSGHWDSIEYLVDKRLAGDGISPGAKTRLEKAQWYLDNVVDNVSEALLRPLIDEMDEVAAAEALKGLRNSKTAAVTVNGKEIVLNVDEYGAAKSSFVDFANEASTNPDRMFPRTISAYFEPRFGEIKTDGAFKWARKFVDREMMFFGETTTQALHRRPAFLASKESFYNRYKAFGWSDEVADAASSTKAAVVTNYVFFDNSAIPQVLHEMNKIFPFFSAMFEVSQTWAYKIPMMSYYGFGLGHLVRRVDRTLSGMYRSGMLDYDPETGSTTFTAANNPDNDSKIISGVSRGVFGLMRQPVNMMEWASNMLDLANGGGYDSADFSSWYKDGFKFAVGNPIDPTSYGLMAVNQFSVGLTPMLQGAASVLARSAYAWDDEIAQIEPQTAAEYIEANPDSDIGLLMAYNRDAFEAANGRETFDKAKLRQIDLTELKMPTELRMPKTSWWETMLDNTVFPFGKYRGGWNVLGDVIAAPLPAALTYVVRGWGMTGQGDTNDWLGLFLGNLSSYQAHAELATQIQMLEASEGYLTRARQLSEKIEQFRTDKKLEINGSGDVQVAKGGTPEDREVLQDMLDQLDDLNTDLVRRATGNTAGALQTRGILGMLGPVSPRSFVKEQEIIAQYWQGKDLAEEFREGRGAKERSPWASNINGLEDMSRLATFTQEWLNDDTGDSAKIWLRQNMPGIEGFLQGRSYYGTVGLSPITDSFEDWNEGIENGSITGVPPEVYMARHQYAAVSTDKQTAIVNKYGNDVDVATQRILSNSADYYDLVDEINVKYDVIEWMDEFLYDGAYKKYRNRGDIDEFSEITLVDAEIRELGDAIDSLEDYLQYGNLGDKEQASVLGDLRATRARWNAARQEMAEYNRDYLNPLEENLALYRDQIVEPYSQKLNDVWERIETAESDQERSDLYRELRMIQDEDYFTSHELESVSGQKIAVPPALVRSWNSKSEEEKALDMYVNLGKPGSWMNQFEVDVLRQQFPNVDAYMPNSESLPLHDKLAQEKAEIKEFARRNPDKMTIYERNQAIDAVEERFVTDMKRAGRQAELDYDAATPFERLDMIGALPSTLQPVADRFNLVMADLRVKDKSPQTQYGRTQIIKFVDQWLAPQFFANDPIAKNDFLELGYMMYDEQGDETLYGIFFQNRTPMSRKLQ